MAKYSEKAAAPSFSSLFLPIESDMSFTPFSLSLRESAIILADSELRPQLVSASSLKDPV